MIVSQPQGRTVLEGGDAVFDVAVTGSLPMTYRWRRNGITLATFITNAHASTFILTNVQMGNAGNYTAAISNPAGNAPVSSNAVLAVLADFDRDGMADLWEAAHGFNTNSAADAWLDADGDRMSNLHEFIAGTDPADAQSYLRVERLDPGRPALLWFAAVSNRSYTVRFSDTLDHGVWDVLTNVPAGLTNRAPRITDPNPGPSRFYRLTIP